MSKTQPKSKFDFILSRRFWAGIIIGATVVMFAGFIETLGFIFANWIDPITAEDCKYGLHNDFLVTRCINDSEMEEILGCKNFYLRDGYWWECVE